MIIESIFGGFSTLIVGVLGFLPQGQLDLPSIGQYMPWYTTLNTGLPLTELLAVGSLLITVHLVLWGFRLVLFVYHQIPFIG